MGQELYYNLNFFNQYYTQYSKPELKSGIDIYIRYTTSHFIDYTDWINGTWEEELNSWKDDEQDRLVLSF